MTKRLSLSNLKKEFPNTNFIELTKVITDDYNLAKNYEDIINNSKLVGYLNEDVEKDEYEVLFDYVEGFLSIADENYVEPEEEDEDYDYFMDDFIDYITDYTEPEAKAILEEIKGEMNYKRIAIVSMDFNAAYLYSNRVYGDLEKVYDNLDVLYKKFIDKIDEEMY